MWNSMWHSLHKFSTVVLFFFFTTVSLIQNMCKVFSLVFSKKKNVTRENWDKLSDYFEGMRENILQIFRAWNVLWIFDITYTLFVTLGLSCSNLLYKKIHLEIALKLQQTFSSQDLLISMKFEPFCDLN